MGIYIVERSGGLKFREEMQRRLNDLAAHIPDAVMECLQRGDDSLAFQIFSPTASDEELKKAYEAVVD